MLDVLAPLTPDAYGLHWSVLHLGEVIADDRWDLNVPVIEQQVRRNPRGLELSFEELLDFASRVHQVIDGVFVGSEWPARLPRHTDNAMTVLEKADMLIATIDSTYWLVSAPANVLSRVEDRFERVTEESPESVQVATLGRS